MKVLIIDDDSDIRLLAAAFLSRDGMTVLDAESGEAGVALAGATAPDVILLDVNMPGLDGLATLQRLHDRPATAAIPVVFLTRKPTDDERQRLLSAGAAGVLDKPFKPAALASAVRDCLVTR